MKSLKDYILLEKLVINKDIANKKETINIQIPKVKNDCIPSDENWEIWKTIKLPKKKFVVYNDSYRSNKMHFADLGDLIGEFIFFQNDYEDWNPDKEILFASDDLNEILEWYFKKLNIPMSIFKEKEYDSAYNIIENNLNDKLTVDSVEFFVRVAIGEWDEKEILSNYLIKEKDYKDEKSLQEWFKRNF